MNVNIVEGVYADVDNETYENVKKDYFDTSLTVVGIKKKYNLSQSEWKVVRKRIVDETGFKRCPWGVMARKKHRDTSTVKNYHICKGRYVVVKYLNGQQRWFGAYETEREAQIMVKLYRDNNWDMSMKEKLEKQMEAML